MFSITVWQVLVKEQSGTKLDGWWIQQSAWDLVVLFRASPSTSWEIKYLVQWSVQVFEKAVRGIKLDALQTKIAAQRLQDTFLDVIDFYCKFSSLISSFTFTSHNYLPCAWRWEDLKPSKAQPALIPHSSFTHGWKARKGRGDGERGKDVRDYFDLVHLSDLGRQQRETGRKMEEWSWWLLSPCIVGRKSGSVQFGKKEKYLQLPALLQLGW